MKRLVGPLMVGTLSLACSSGGIGAGGDAPRPGDSFSAGGDTSGGDLRTVGDVVTGGDEAIPTENVRYVDTYIGTASCSTYDPATRNCGSGDQAAHSTMAGAAAAAVPGETVFLRGGIYGDALIPQSSGLASQPITYRSYPGETATITGASLVPAIDISGRDYLVIADLEITDVRRWMYARNSHHNVITGNTFRRALDSGGSSKTGLFFEEATFNRVVDNTIDDSTQDNLSLIKSDRNVIENNIFRKADHTLWTIKCGNYNILRGNDFHNAVQKIGEIYDCDGVGFDHQFTAVNATKHNLVEDNDFTYTASSGDASPYAGIQYAGQQGIVRRNRFYDTTGPALQMTLYSGEAEYNTDNRVYHNVFAGTDFAGVEISASTSYSFSGNEFVNNVFVHSIFVANDTRWAWYVNTLAGKPVQIKTGRLDGSYVFDTNCVFNATVDELYLITHGWREESTSPHTISWWESNHGSMFKNTLEVDPGFEDEAGHDFRLASTSDLVDAGRFLTTATSTNSGTTLPVADALWFVDGFGIPGEQGDLIQLDGSTERARVLSVDYGAKVLTLDRSMSWTSGQGVSLAYEGEGPDVGVD